MGIVRAMTLKLVVLLPLVCCAAFSQGTTPPPIVRILSTGGPNRPGYADTTVDVIGLTATTGAPQTWWIEMHPSFASIEDHGSSSGYLGNDSRAMIGVLQPGWSYLPEEAVRSLPRARYVRVTVYRIRPGTETDFARVAQYRKVASDKVTAGRADLFYHVVSGDDTGTYIALSPLASMSALDDGAADPPPSAPAEVLAKEAEIEISREHYLFRVEPRLSHVSGDFANGDPHFWRP
jgi:hypothetical protein